MTQANLPKVTPKAPVPAFQPPPPDAVCDIEAKQVVKLTCKGRFPTLQEIADFVKAADNIGMSAEVKVTSWNDTRDNVGQFVEIIVND